VAFMPIMLRLFLRLSQPWRHRYVFGPHDKHSVIEMPVSMASVRARRGPVAQQLRVHSEAFLLITRGADGACCRLRECAAALL